MSSPSRWRGPSPRSPSWSCRSWCAGRATNEPRETKRDALREPLLAALGPDPQGVRKLAQLVGGTRATTTAALEELERDGLAQVTPMGWLAGRSYRGDQPATQEQPDQALFDASENGHGLPEDAAAALDGTRLYDQPNPRRPTTRRTHGAVAELEEELTDLRMSMAERLETRAEKRAERLRALQGARPCRCLRRAVAGARPLLEVR